MKQEVTTDIEQEQTEGTEGCAQRLIWSHQTDNAFRCMGCVPLGRLKIAR